MTTVRTFTDLERATSRPLEQRADDELLALADDFDFELSFLKKHYRAGSNKPWNEPFRASAQANAMCFVRA